MIQLDDLDGAAVDRLRPVSFLALCTSLGNYQCWVAVADGDADFARRLRKGTGADLGASGTAAWQAASITRRNTLPPSRVEMVHANPGLIVTRSELEAIELVAPVEPPLPVLPPPVFLPLPSDAGRVISAAWRTPLRPEAVVGLMSAVRILHGV